MTPTSYVKQVVLAKYQKINTFSVGLIEYTHNDNGINWKDLHPSAISVFFTHFQYLDCIKYFPQYLKLQCKNRINVLDSYNFNRAEPYCLLRFLLNLFIYMIKTDLFAYFSKIYKNSQKQISKLFNFHAIHKAKIQQILSKY